MSTPQDRLQEDVKAALKAGHKTRLSTVRLLLGEVKNERIRTGRDVDETTFLGLVQRAIKRRREAAEQYRKGHRPELAEQEEQEAAILAAYLPPPASESELRTAAQELAGQLGATGPAALGPMMKALRDRFAGRAEGTTLQRIVRDVLSSLGKATSGS